MCGARRYAVVFLCFIGLLLSIGSREVFSIVVTHVIQSGSSSESPNDNLFPHCIPRNDSRNLEKKWDSEFVFLFQTVYFVGYIITQVPGGFLAVKLTPRRVFGGCILISSVLNVVMRFAIQYHYWLVFVVRFLQGLIEGPSIPALNGVISKWALKSEKSKLVTMAYSGAYLSAAVASVSTGVLICYVSWGSGLFVYGGAGVLWALFWLWFVDDSPASCKGMSEREKERFRQENRHIVHGHRDAHNTIPWRKLLTSLPLSAIFVAAFCRNWIFALLITQIPQYYKDVFLMHASEYGLWSSLPHVFMTVVVISGGILVDKVIKKKYISTTIARKAAETIGFGVEASCIMALGFLDNKYQAVVLLCVGVAVSGLAISGYQTNPLDLAPQYVSIMTGIVRLGTIGSVLSTVVAVKYPAREHTLTSWHTVFIISASIHFFGVLYYLIFASGERQPWAVDDDLERSIVKSQTTKHVTYGATTYEDSNRLVPNGISSEAAINQNDMDHVAGVYEDDEDDDEQSLFTKSLQVEGLSYSDSDEEATAWFLGTI